MAGRGQNPRPPRFQQQEAERRLSDNSSEGEGWKEVVKGRKVGRGRGEEGRPREEARTSYRKQDVGYSGRRSYDSNPRGHQYPRKQDRRSQPIQDRISPRLHSEYNRTSPTDRTYTNKTSPVDQYSRTSPTDRTHHSRTPPVDQHSRTSSTDRTQNRRTPPVDHTSRTTPPLYEQDHRTNPARTDRRSQPRSDRVSPRNGRSPRDRRSPGEPYHPAPDQPIQHTKPQEKPCENAQSRLARNAQPEFEREYPVQLELVRYLAASWALTANKLKETEMVWPQKIVYYNK